LPIIGFVMHCVTSDIDLLYNENIQTNASWIIVKRAFGNSASLHSHVYGTQQIQLWNEL
jgi:hypothetical protein